MTMRRLIFTSMIAFALMEGMKSPGGRALVGVDHGQDDETVETPYYYEKSSQERLARAEIKRAKKKLKRLGLKAFPMTGPGCDQAKLFLAAIGQQEEFESNGQSVDGYSLVAWANAELEKVKS